MSGSTSSVSSVGDSISSWVDTSNDNIYAALAAQQQSKLAREQMAAEAPGRAAQTKKMLEEWRLMQQQWQQGEEQEQWRRGFRNALMTGTAQSSGQNFSAAGRM
jgi:hydrogenase maturation factor HypF (carbamoyltransferase family)